MGRAFSPAPVLVMGPEGPGLIAAVLVEPHKKLVVEFKANQGLHLFRNFVILQLGVPIARQSFAAFCGGVVEFLIAPEQFSQQFLHGSHSFNEILGSNFKHVYYTPNL